MQLEDIQRNSPGLLYRRQFLLGPERTGIGSRWHSYDLASGLVLSTHSDLSIVHSRGATGILAILGIVADSNRLNVTPQQIADEINDCDTVEQVMRATLSLCGRWAMVVIRGGRRVIFGDALGSKAIYFYRKGPVFWCGSQPELIKVKAGLLPNNDPQLRRLMDSIQFRRQEQAFVGDGTPYHDCFRVLPNHFLDLCSHRVHRWYPYQPLQRLTLSESAARSADLLRNSINALGAAGHVRLALTAGWDSRVLLAASRSLKDRMTIFVDRMGVLSEDHRDIRIPKELAARNGFSLTVQNSNLDPSSEMTSVLQASVTGARQLPKTRTIFSYLWETSTTTLTFTGNGGEICRNPYDKYNAFGRRLPVAEDLAHFMHYRGIDYAVRTLGWWRQDATNFLFNSYRILDLLYWEQRVGIWGTQMLSEQDIACDAVSPYSNRLLLETLLGCPPRHRTAPNYRLHREIIRRLWPELLTVKINPGRRRRIDLAVRWLPKWLIRKTLLRLET